MAKKEEMKIKEKCDKMEKVRRKNRTKVQYSNPVCFSFTQSLDSPT